jgi:hypothetical protein
MTEDRRQNAGQGAKLPDIRGEGSQVAPFDRNLTYEGIHERRKWDGGAWGQLEIPPRPPFLKGGAKVPKSVKRFLLQPKIFQIFLASGVTNK